MHPLSFCGRLRIFASSMISALQPLTLSGFGLLWGLSCFRWRFDFTYAQMEHLWFFWRRGLSWHQGKTRAVQFLFLRDRLVSSTSARVIKCNNMIKMNHFFGGMEFECYRRGGRWGFYQYFCRDDSLCFGFLFQLFLYVFLALLAVSFFITKTTLKNCVILLNEAVWARI